MLIWLYLDIDKPFTVTKKVSCINVAGHHSMELHLIHQLIQLLLMVKSPIKTAKITENLQFGKQIEFLRN